MLLALCISRYDCALLAWMVVRASTYRCTSVLCALSRPMFHISRGSPECPEKSVGKYSSLFPWQTWCWDTRCLFAPESQPGQLSMTPHYESVVNIAKPARYLEWGRLDGGFLKRFHVELRNDWAQWLSQDDSINLEFLKMFSAGENKTFVRRVMRSNGPRHISPDTNHTQLEASLESLHDFINFICSDRFN